MFDIRWRFAKLMLCGHVLNSPAPNATLCSLQPFQQDPRPYGRLLSCRAVGWVLHIHQFRFSIARLAQDICSVGSVWSRLIVSNQPLPGVYLCVPTTYPALIPYNVFPAFAFESIVFCLSIWAGYRHSKENFSGLRWSREHLVDILVRGNVVYYFG